jgi:hypothetical protein
LSKSGKVLVLCCSDWAVVGRDSATVTKIKSAEDLNILPILNEKGEVWSAEQRLAGNIGFQPVERMS